MESSLSAEAAAAEMRAERRGAEIEEGPATLVVAVVVVVAVEAVVEVGSFLRDLRERTCDLVVEEDGLGTGTWLSEVAEVVDSQSRVGEEVWAGCCWVVADTVSRWRCEDDDEELLPVGSMERYCYKSVTARSGVGR